MTAKTAKWVILPVELGHFDLRLTLLSIAAISCLAACDARVNVPPSESKTTIVTPGGEKKTETNTTVVTPTTEKKTETNTTVTPGGGTVEKSTTTTVK